MKCFLILCIVVTLVVGCDQRLDPQPKETFTIDGYKVEFSPPPPDWKKHLQRRGLDDTNEEGEFGADRILAIRFDHPSGKGHLAVTHVRQNKKIAEPQVLDEKTGEVKKEAVLGDYIEIEDDKMTLNQIAAQVVKRDGEIITKGGHPGEYITVDGDQAFRMEYTYGKGDLLHHGVQVHMTKMERHFTIALDVPESEFAEAGPVFNLVVESFRVKEKLDQPTDVYPENEASPAPAKKPKK